MNGFLVHILVVFVALLLTMRLLQWGKFFRLDELPEFNRSVLEVMRKPLEDRVITISRAKYSTEYPASFMFVASMNSCPCWCYGHPMIVRCHRAFLVNLAQVGQIVSRAGALQLVIKPCNESRPVSRSHAAQVKAAIS